MFVLVGIDVVEILLDFVRIIPHQTSCGKYAFHVRDCIGLILGARPDTCRLVAVARRHVPRATHPQLNGQIRGAR